MPRVRTQQIFNMKQTRNLFLLLLVLGLPGVLFAATSPPADFYVSTTGSDAWSGTLAESNAQGRDGPFATLLRARDAVRELKQYHSADIVVLIREGTYRLDETVVFGLEDSGEGDNRITYRAYPGETPVFSSGVEVTDWRKPELPPEGLPPVTQGKVLVAEVSASFKTLYDREGRLPRARSEGFIPLKVGSRDRLHYPTGKLRNWSNVEDVEVIVRPHHAWIVNVLPLKSVDEAQSMAHTSVSATYAMNVLHFLKETPSAWVENVLEELDEPGEWALNTKEGKVYLWPRSDGPVLRPQLQELIRIEGDVDKEGPTDIPVRNLTFQGLTFMHGGRYTLTDADAGVQHDWDMLDLDNALVRLRGTENVAIKDCHFTASGSGAIRVDLHGQKNVISGNHIEHMGGGGILLCGYGPGTKDVNKHNTVVRNHIHNVGEIYGHSPGIMLWQSGENRVAHNLIHHTPYTGIIISGFMSHFFERGDNRELVRTIRWQDVGRDSLPLTEDQVSPYLHSRNNLIESNEIHHAMEELGDGNGIYIRGAGPGNVIRRNYLHHLVAPMLMQAAIRTDGGQRDTLITENVIYKCTAQGIIIKLNNRAVNNFVVDVIAPPRGFYISLREGPMAGAAIQRNIFYASGTELEFVNELAPGNGKETEDSRGRELARAVDADSDYNIYYSASDPSRGEAHLADARKDGIDRHSSAANPLFVDPENEDFRFAPNSPARKMGIREIDISNVGLRGQQEAQVGADTKKPNIVFIFADDWGYGDLSLHGSDWMQTPHLDQMAAEGIDFQNFTVNSPVCSPSRVAVMTGHFPARYNIHQHFAGIQQNARRGMPDWLDTNGPLLPRLLQNACYTNGHFGKWHLGAGNGVPIENEYGYDAFATFNGSKQNDIPKDALASVDHAEKFIRANHDKPFFVNLWLHETHLPHYPLDQYLAQFKDLDEQKRVYASVIAEGDAGVGRILSLLKELGLDENTLVVFSSDNGPEAERGEEAKFHKKGEVGFGGYYSVGESGGLIGQKRSLYAGGVRVPFIVRWPGIVPAGRVDRGSTLTAVDLLPTFLDAAGVPLPGDYKPDGQSALAAFKGNAFSRTKPIFWEWRGGISKDYTWPTLGVRAGRWKLLRNDEHNKIELYDLENDWAEKSDVAAQNPAIVKMLKAKIDAWKMSLPSDPLASSLSPARNK